MMKIIFLIIIIRVILSQNEYVCDYDTDYYYNDMMLSSSLEPIKRTSSSSAEINSNMKNSNITFVDWLSQINLEYELLNQYSAYYVWELSVNPTDDLYNKASKLGDIRIKWINKRCNEATNYYDNIVTFNQKRIIFLLCRGPKYTQHQANELSLLLTKIQNIYTDTQICLPKSFDICINYNRIWDYTYFKTPEGSILSLDMTSVINPNEYIDYNPLNYYNKNFIDDDYYVLRGYKKYKIKQKYNFNCCEHSIDKMIRKEIESSSSSQSLCMNIEPHLENIMSGNFSVLKRSDCALPTNLILRWAWEAWKLTVGNQIGKFYPNIIYLLNVGAKNNGYNDIGESWREEIEIENLRSIVTKLWNDFKPYYQKFHAVLRNALWKKFSLTNEKEMFNMNGSLPAHLLGNMWAQDWSAYNKLLNPLIDVDLDENFLNSNWTTIDMVKKADDFYSSLGLKPMTKKFWKNSIFNKTTKLTKCHGSAANMYKEDDFRMIACAERKLQDFYVIVHEMGHIQYYMNSYKQIPILNDATNSAFNEAIGDAIYLAMMTPQHLNRLGLISDDNLFIDGKSKLSSFLYDSYFNNLRIIHEINESNHNYKKSNDDYLNSKINFFKNLLNNENDKPIINLFDISLLLRIGLSKLPQIPFEYILDIYRWDLFSGKINNDEINNYFWNLTLTEQGVKPLNLEKRKYFFDAGSKFHVADNTPYIRYFFASILQAQIFKGLCEKTIFDEVNSNQKLPIPLHRCDIYGSKRAGNLLKKALSLGASAHWKEVLFILTGKTEISIDPLIEYYELLFKWIDKTIFEFYIPIGW